MDKRILVIGKQNHLGWVEHTLTGFLETSCKIEHLFINKLSVKNTLLKAIYKSINYKEGELQLQLSELSDKIKTFKPTLVVFVGAFFIPYELFALCKENNIYTAGWVGDSFGEDKKNNLSINYIPFIDNLYVSDSALVATAKNLGFKETHFLQFGYNSKLHTNKNLYRRETINFIGSFTQERNIAFQSLKNNHLEIYGTHWNQLDPISYKWKIKNQKINQKEVVHIYNTTLATLNVAQKSNIINMVNMRTFEAIACGSCLINDNVKDIELCFDPNKEILIYETLEELEELSYKVLQDTKYANQIAKAGYNRIVKSHYSYKDRALQILQDFNIRI